MSNSVDEDYHTVIMMDISDLWSDLLVEATRCCCWVHGPWQTLFGRASEKNSAIAMLAAYKSYTAYTVLTRRGLLEYSDPNLNISFQKSNLEVWLWSKMFKLYFKLFWNVKNIDFILGYRFSFEYLENWCVCFKIYYFAMVTFPNGLDCFRRYVVVSTMSIITNQSFEGKKPVGQI